MRNVPCCVVLILELLLTVCKDSNQKPSTQDNTPEESQSGSSYKAHPKLPFALNLPYGFELIGGYEHGSVYYKVHPPAGKPVSLDINWRCSDDFYHYTRESIQKKDLKIITEKETIWLRGLENVIAQETLWVYAEPLFVYKKKLYRNAEDSIYGGRPAIKAVMAHRGYGYWFSMDIYPYPSGFLPDTQACWESLDWTIRMLAQGLENLPEKPDTFLYMEDEYYEAIKELFHSRPFWIAGADTLGPIDRSSIEYLTSRPLFVPRMISGFPEEGLVEYWADYPEVEKPTGCDNRPVTMVTIFWRPAFGNKKADDSLTLTNQKRIRRHILRELYYHDPAPYDRPCEIKWDSSFSATFKGFSVQGFSLRYPGDPPYEWSYRTDLFFEREGFEFQIVAISDERLGPRFLSPKDKLWRWLESHWYWMDEPHPDWSRYPIHYDSIKYKRAEDDIPPEERSSEDP